MTKSFVHLHAHTEYSMLDGAAKIVDYLKKVKELNQPAAAITDHGNLYGAMEFVQKANDFGIKPILGMKHTSHQVPDLIGQIEKIIKDIT